MSPRQSDARQRVVMAAAEMLARHGLNATSIREMAKRAEAPLGSTYHHFPGGKQQVVVEAVKFAGARVGAGLDHHLKAGAVAGLRGFLAMWRDILVRSDFRIGCPVMATAVDEPIDDLAEEALAAAAAVFSDWQRKLVASLEAQGRDRASASRLATLIIASVEGAIVLCRAQRSIASFDQIAEQLEALVSHA
ncbi:TetR/AcrR family transcriptional regulator [Ralstonia syzygii subsp. celebesensis]|uniref:TetR/AcrR family transcriptional regulator n=3 Tax=Ralstonia solanacearum species complex TaxID=3116862 RepID=A0AAD0SAQ1_RALSL|nr:MULTISPECIES: TetR/AcrR family transcriptional regulator [Ralstonia solanacearum species complex]CCA83457.1 putative transcription regulator protein,TetR-related [blood disease bacterium R229]AQW32464.1 TetR family transcriptional regulator [blood disease bacterium A2-HR MARDI]AXV83834.1 TetR/AcrR family transcriptional regulator [Ralstonia solanacearum]AXW54966.1 TetR/AcrR family transcriptional regulator [Ralstonia solanacearum]QQV57987.1 TetR/AcrR family transcriptional regulator [Ralsto